MRSLRHRQVHQEHGEDHRILGLEDRETAQMVLTGLDSPGFRRLFKIGRYSPERQATREIAPGTGGGGGRGGRGGRAAIPLGDGDLPGRRMRVIVEDLIVTDMVTIGFNIMARRFPEMVPPELLQTERGYRVAMSQVVEDAMLVLLQVLAETFPDRFTPDDVRTAILVGAIQHRITELSEEATA